MAEWQRRRADTLAAALLAHRRKHPGPPHVDQRLGAVQVVVARAAKTILTTADEVDAHRGEVCKICRGNQLYACDVPSGWSPNCELVNANVSRFGEV